MRKSSLDAPSLDELECLICWPKNTVGEREERALTKALLELCRQHGFGRVPQLAAQIEDIWRNPDKVMQYEKDKQDHIKLYQKAAVSI